MTSCTWIDTGLRAVLGVRYLYIPIRPRYILRCLLRCLIERLYNDFIL